MFGTHVGYGSNDTTRCGQVDIGKLGDPEVDDLHEPVLGDQDVGRLDVPVYDATLVGFAESGADLDRVLDGLGNAERTPVELGLEALTVVERHRDEQLAVVGFADLVDRADVGVVE